MLKLLKPYKEVKPLVTINKIRSVLNDIGIFVTEQYKKDGDYFTCRIEIANDNLSEFKIGTNGKGISLEYAYASAYAEFMERLQNNMLLENSFFFSKYFERDCTFKEQLKKENKELDFIFCPQEKIIETTKIVDDNYEMLCKSFSIKNKDELKDFIINTLGYKKVISIPFYNQRLNKTDYLPIDLLVQGTGSTGMCAGNSPEEALVQGISEILERYTAQEIHINKITPPTIPHDYFEEYPIYNSIKKLEEKGLEIIIKDFSLGKKLPVIGVIVIDKNTRKYNVKVGSDLWPITALERCLTELHQSFKGIRLIDKCDYGDFIEGKYKELNRADAEHINLTNIFNNATGQWPDSILSCDFSYTFTGLDFNYGRSNKLDLKHLLQLISELDSQLFIRDVSFLGFHSYYIVAPGLSQDKRKKSDYSIFNKLYSLTSDINNVSSLSKDDLTFLVSTLETNYIAIKEGYLNFENFLTHNTDADATDLTLDLFLSMANYKLSNIDKAYLHLKYYLKDKEVQDYLYFYACKDYLALLKNGESNNEIKYYLSKIYGFEVANEVIEDMFDADNIFKAYNLNWCFDSKKCIIKDFKYFKAASIFKNIETKHKTQPVDQMNLAKVFNFN
ncbi:YcaO-like family protein [Marinifilum sp.]|uniref:YcaO-like family protein n=1 Tax=Marinifilum sp. TaxID=2033137 RepID=UPI003BAB27CF